MNGLVSEGSGENIFVVYRGVLYTPPVGASILMGVTRECVLTLARELGIEVREQTFPREMLYVADEIFFTGTAVEISPVRSVDKVQVGSGAPRSDHRQHPGCVLRHPQWQDARPARLAHVSWNS